MTALSIGIDAGTGPLVLLLHGFPELPSSWRLQVDPLVAQGYRVVAPYLRGYGPSPAVAGDQLLATTIADDIADTIEACGEEQAVVVGHDWGAVATWMVAQLRPERVRAMAALSVPYPNRSSRPPTQVFQHLFGDSFFYINYFQEPGTAESELEPQLERFLVGIYAAASASPPPGALRQLPASAGFLEQLPEPDALPVFLDPALLDEAVQTFGRAGLAGPLAYYRGLDPTWEQVPAFGATDVTCPAMFLAGERDTVLAFTPLDAMRERVTDLRRLTLLPEAGHWVQAEAPEAVTAELLGFLATV